MGRGENDQGVSFRGAETAQKLIVDDNYTTLRTLKAIGLYILNGQIKKHIWKGLPEIILAVEE